MGLIATDKRKITLFYHSDTSLGKQTIAYVTASEMQVLTIDISKTKVTGTQWVELADKLGVQVSDFVNKEHPDFKEHYDSHASFSTDDWIKVLHAHPSVLQYPIMIYNDAYHFIETPSEIARFLDSSMDAKDPRSRDTN